MHAPLPVTKFVPGIHRVEQFDCGHPDISQWLKDRVHEESWPDKTSVTVALDGAAVVGFYALLSSLIKYRNAPSDLTEPQSDKFDIPATYLKVIAVDRTYQGQGYGSDLLLHALETAVTSVELGITSFAVHLHAADEGVARWYAKRGFRPLIEGDPKRSMYISMSQIQATLNQWGHLK